MAILLTGGTGKTSACCARLCKDAGVPFILASRKAIPAVDMPTAKFDYTDPSTYGNAFEYRFPNGERITAVYLTAAEIADPAPAMIDFIDYAIEKQHVKRFVFMTGSMAEQGPVWFGPAL